MACTTCSSGGCSTKEGTKGCGSTGCSTGGCNKLNTYDWFTGISNPAIPEADTIYEVRFKATHKDFFRNVNGLSLITGDMVIVESDRGFNVGQISLSGVLARLQMRKKNVKDSPDRIPKIFRKAVDEDIEKLKLARSREYSTLVRSRMIVEELDLNMKVSDVEFQGDNTKAIFYYIADHRVDFRTLIKRFADEFRVRVEMRQIGLRYESGLIGGIGSCGRELCCSTWLTDFKTVTTTAARYQNLALNPMKISGQCGRLKCCLNYELETYLDALEDIPNVHHIETAMGPGVLQKTDIFKKIMWFSYQGESTWIPIEVHFVKEMLEMNRKGVKPESLHHGTTGDNAVKIEKIDFVDVVGQSQHRNEPSRKKGKRKSSDRRDDRPRGENRNAGGENRNENRPQSENRPQTQNRNQNRPANNPNQDRPNPESKEANAGGPKEGGQPRNNPNRGPRNNQGRNQRPPNRQGPADSNRPRSYDRPPPNDNPGA